MSRPRRHLWAAAALVLAGCAGPVSDDAGAPGAPADVTEGTQVVTVDGTERTYRLHLPDDLDEPAPLVLLFHGLGGDAVGIEQYSEWPAVAAEHGVVLASPDGIGRSFDGGGCCGSAASEGVDDVGTALAVIDDVAERVSIDPDRVYATGFSNGGHMSYRLACETDRFAAVAPVMGARLVDCPNPDAALLHVHGMGDRSVPVAGEERPGGVVVPPAEDVVAQWRDAWACEAPTRDSDDGVHRTSASCGDRGRVDLVLLDRAGHIWPRATDGFDTTRLTWDFFAEHRR
ncbi:MAG: PHB depolymerase family esterase [Mobilicoccus sp.]|nr:PHB depolymerase family esterase [Mobilicoccus sp.]